MTLTDAQKAHAANPIPATLTPPPSKRGVLNVAPHFALPRSAITEAIAVVGMRGSGKTNTAVVIAEEMFRESLPFCVIDPVGVWWGLRAAPDGKGAGLSVPIIGGEHADVPITEDQGEQIAEFVAEGAQPCVLDLSDFRKGAAVRFMTAFAEKLYALKGRNRTALHLIVDEADAYIPQRPAPDETRLLGAFEDLVRRGRSRGVGLTMITQRPAVLNKNVLTQAGCLVVMRMTGPQDQAAVEDWVKLHASDEQRRALLHALPSLAKGTAFFFSPEWLGGVYRVGVRARETFDSSRTPSPDEKRTAPTMKIVDVDALRMRLAPPPPPEPKKRKGEKTADEIGAETVLTAQKIDEVRRELADQLAEKADALMQNFADVYRVMDGEFEKLTTQMDRLFGDVPSWASIRAKEKRLAKTEGIEVSEVQGVMPTIDFGALDRVAKDVARGTGGFVVPAHDGVNFRLQGKAKDLNPIAGAGKMLVVLGRYRQGLSRKQIGTLASYTPSGGTFQTYFSVLNVRGLIEVAGTHVKLSPLVGEHAVESIPRATAEERACMWFAALGAGPTRMLVEVAKRQRLSRATLGAVTHYEPSGGTFQTYLSVLRANGLVSIVKNDVLWEPSHLDASALLHVAGVASAT